MAMVMVTIKARSLITGTSKCDGESVRELVSSVSSEPETAFS